MHALSRARKRERKSSVDSKKTSTTSTTVKTYKKTTPPTWYLSKYRTKGARLHSRHITYKMWFVCFFFSSHFNFLSVSWLLFFLLYLRATIVNRRIKTTNVQNGNNNNTTRKIANIDAITNKTAIGRIKPLNLSSSSSNVSYFKSSYTFFFSLGLTPNWNNG